MIFVWKKWNFSDLTADNHRLKNDFEELKKKHSQRLTTIETQVSASNKVLEELETLKKEMENLRDKE